LKALKKLVANKDKRFGEAHILQQQQRRPWGRQRELCNVWVVSLQALLRPVAPNVLLKEGRPSLFSLIEKELPPIAFPFTVDLLKDSLRIYQSPYGQVSDTEEIEFPACDCVDEKRNRPKRHNPCLKAAVVLVKSVYMEEEANRRESEEVEYIEQFKMVEEEITVWLHTAEGKKSIQLEVTRRKKMMKEEVVVRKEMLSAQQLKYRKASQELKKVMIKKQAYENGEPFAEHGYNALSEAVKELSVAEGKVLLINERIAALKQTIDELKKKIDGDYEQHCHECVQDLLKKYCCINYRANLNKYRRLALENNLNRHWDGEDGQDYLEWWKFHTVVGKEKSMREIEMEKEEAKAAAEEEEQTGPEYDWDETDHMDRFDNYLVNRYLKSKAGFFSFMI
jgi:hypothetical protein